MIEFENLKELGRTVQEAREKPAGPLSVFSSFVRMAVFLVLYAVVMVVTAYVVYMTFSRAARIVKVPSVVNRNFTDAYIALKKLDLDVHVVPQGGYTDTPHGTVVAQSIPAGSVVKERRKIVLTVAVDPRYQPIAVEKGDRPLRSVSLEWQVPRTLESEEVDVAIFVTDEGRYKNTLVFQQRLRRGETVRLPLQVVGRASREVKVDGQPVDRKDL